MTYFTVTTRDVNHRETRRIECHDLGTAYSVAAQLRQRIYGYGRYGTMPLSTTAIRLTELEGIRGQGRVVACSTWEGAPTMSEAVANAAAATWRAIPADAPWRGACVPLERRGCRIGPQEGWRK